MRKSQIRFEFPLIHNITNIFEIMIFPRGVNRILSYSGKYNIILLTQWNQVFIKQPPKKSYLIYSGKNFQ